MAATLHEVGRRAGVSAMTVSRVVNGRGGVDSETRRRVEEAIQALDYVPNRIARGLISQKTQTIGLIVPDVVNPFFAPVVRGAESAARKAGYGFSSATARAISAWSANTSKTSSLTA